MKKIQSIQDMNRRKKGKDQIQNMSLISSALAVFHKSTEEFFEPVGPSSNRANKVFIRLMFLRIGEIDTLNEKYQASASIESRWAVEYDQFSEDLSYDEQQRFYSGKSISLIQYHEKHWHPQLFIENALGDLKETIRYSAKVSREDHLIYICEHRDIKGLFWEKLELQHFPSDVQDLSISIGSMLYDDKVILVADPYHASGINREAFVDQQEWSLYEHVDTQQRFIKEFLFRDDEEDDEDEQNQINQQHHKHLSKYTQRSENNKERNRSILTVTCHAARRSNYFYWNGYCLILLITLVSFCVFAIPPNLAASRIQISCTLLLTSITFRWTVNRSLPTISYLTIMDQYAIMCLFILVILSIWHAIIGALIFYYVPDQRVTPEIWFVQLDRYVFYLSVLIYLILHMIVFLWHYFVPLKLRRRLKEKDDYYREIISKKSLSAKKKLRNGPHYIPITIES